MFIRVKQFWNDREASQARAKEIDTQKILSPEENTARAIEALASIKQDDLLRLEEGKNLIERSKTNIEHYKNILMESKKRMESIPEEQSPLLIERINACNREINLIAPLIKILNDGGSGRGKAGPGGREQVHQMIYEPKEERKETVTNMLPLFHRILSDLVHQSEAQNQPISELFKHALSSVRNRLNKANDKYEAACKTLSDFKELKYAYIESVPNGKGEEKYNAMVEKHTQTINKLKSAKDRLETEIRPFVALESAFLYQSLLDSTSSNIRSIEKNIEAELSSINQMLRLYTPEIKHKDSISHTGDIMSRLQKEESSSRRLSLSEEKYDAQGDLAPAPFISPIESKVLGASTAPKENIDKKQAELFEPKTEVDTGPSAPRFK